MKEEILKLRKEGKSYRQIEKLLKCSKSTISYHCQKLELNTPVEYIPKIKTGKYKIIKEERNCIICQKSIINKHYKQKTCSPSCGSKSKNNLIYENYIKDWKKGANPGGDIKFGKVSGHVRKYLFFKYSNRCAECGWGELNEFTNSIPLEVEHIDSNPTNHKENNLTLLCPNCHSLKEGHSPTKSVGRRYYREQYYKNKYINENVEQLVGSPDCKSGS